MFQFLKLLILVTPMIAACRSNPPSEGCVASALEDPATIVAENPYGAKITITHDQRMKDAPYYPSHSGESSSCTAHVDFEEVDGVYKAIEIEGYSGKFQRATLWTARHCLRPEIAKKVSLELHKHQEVEIVVPELKFYSHLRKLLAVNDGEGLKQSILNNVVYYSRLIDDLQSHSMTEQFISDNPEWGQVSQDSIKKRYPHIRKFAEEIFSETKEHGRPLCPREMEVENLETKALTDLDRGQKFCFLSTDLAAYTIYIPVSEEESSDDSKKLPSEDLLILAKGQGETKDYFEREMKIKRSPRSDIGSFIKKRRALSYSYAIYRIQKDVLEKGFDFLSEIRRQLKLIPIKNLDSHGVEFMDSISREEVDPSQAIRKTLDEFVSLMDASLERDYEISELISEKVNNYVQVTTRLDEKGLSDVSVPVAQLRKSQKRNPIESKRYGYVSYSEDLKIRFKPGDSGSLLTILGIFPLAALSTIDDQDVSGIARFEYTPASIHPVPEGAVFDGDPEGEYKKRDDGFELPEYQPRSGVGSTNSKKPKDDKNVKNPKNDASPVESPPQQPSVVHPSDINTSPDIQGVTGIKKTYSNDSTIAEENPIDNPCL